MSENYLGLDGVTTPEIIVEVSKKETVFAGAGKFMDADDELLQIAKYIKTNTPHHSTVNPERIKYLYTTFAKKDGGKFIPGSLILRSEMEKVVNNDYDYIILVHYKGWKELSIEHKVIQLDKILCGISVSDDNVTKKVAADSKEYSCSMRHFGSDVVHKSAEIADMAIDRILSEEKEQKKNKE